MLRKTRRFTDCGLSCSVYQRCYTDSLGSFDSCQPSAEVGGEKSKVTFYIGGGDETDSEGGGATYYEEECSFGFQKLLKANLLAEVLALFRANFGRQVFAVGLEGLFPSVIAQLLHLSEDEPYGVRGASLEVVLDKGLNLRRKGSTAAMSTVSSSDSTFFEEPPLYAAVADDDRVEDFTSLGTIKMCTETVTTFELTLTLKEGKNLRVSIRNWMAYLVGSKHLVVIEPTFTFRKRRLYRNN